MYEGYTFKSRYDTVVEVLKVCCPSPMQCHQCSYPHRSVRAQLCRWNLGHVRIFGWEGRSPTPGLRSWFESLVMSLVEGSRWVGSSDRSSLLWSINYHPLLDIIVWCVFFFGVFGRTSVSSDVSLVSSDVSLVSSDVSSVYGRFHFLLSSPFIPFYHFFERLRYITATTSLFDPPHSLPNESPEHR
jgi:hypothetical protein